MSRVLRAAAISALFALFLGGLVVFSYHLQYRGKPNPPGLDNALVFATTMTMVTFWIIFLVLYVATVHKSRTTLEFEEQARLEERRRVERTKEALKPREGSR